MLTKTEFLAALKRETRILSHLAGTLEAKHLDFRLTPAQRSTIELLRYLTIQNTASTTYFLNGNWDHWDGLDAKAATVDLASFPTALKAQERTVARLLAPISDKAWQTRLVKPMSGKGRGIPLGTALFETTLTWCIAYRMQLFLQAKAAGLSGLKSKDLWAGKP